METTEQVKGAFVESLQRNNKQIRHDRAEAIGEDAQMMYKRQVEDLVHQRRQVERDRENMLDMSPDNTTSMKLASDFNAADFATKDLDLSSKLYNLDIKIKIAKERYKHLFGEEI